METSLFISSYPTVRMQATSFVYDYLLIENRVDIIEKYNLHPFEINVQDINRTFIDKIFALGDYYLSDNVAEHSRHIYDLYKLIEKVEINDNLKELFKVVKEERSCHSACLSAQEGINLKEFLQNIVNKKVYKSDYENITLSLLFEKVEYDEAVTSIERIIDSGLVD